MPVNVNPLKKFFRQPAIYIKLPSAGKHWVTGSIDVPINGEFPVYPMTAMDEITYRTADALFNGAAVVKVIESCVPNIKDAWKIPSTDLDTILVGIRIASYGHEMQFDSECPYCQNENSFGLDLRTVMDGITVPDYDKTVTIGDLEIYFKPLDYHEVNRNAMVQFEDQKLLEMLPNSDLPEEEKVRRINDAFLKLTSMTMTAIAQSIAMIRIGTDVVADAVHIEEFINNCDRSTFDHVRSHIIELKQSSELKPLKIKCQNPDCNKVYETPFTLDVSNFFGAAS